MATVASLSVALVQSPAGRTALVQDLDAERERITPVRDGLLGRMLFCSPIEPAQGVDVDGSFRATPHLFERAGDGTLLALPGYPHANPGSVAEVTNRWVSFTQLIQRTVASILKTLLTSSAPQTRESTLLWLRDVAGFNPPDRFLRDSFWVNLTGAMLKLFNDLNADCAACHMPTGVVEVAECFEDLVTIGGMPWKLSHMECRALSSLTLRHVNHVTDLPTVPEAVFGLTLHFMRIGLLGAANRFVVQKETFEQALRLYHNPALVTVSTLHRHAWDSVLFNMEHHAALVRFFSFVQEWICHSLKNIAKRQLRCLAEAPAGSSCCAPKPCESPKRVATPTRSSQDDNLMLYLLPASVVTTLCTWVRSVIRRAENHSEDSLLQVARVQAEVSATLLSLDQVRKNGELVWSIVRVCTDLGASVGASRLLHRPTCLSACPSVGHSVVGCFVCRPWLWSPALRFWERAKVFAASWRTLTFCFPDSCARTRRSLCFRVLTSTPTTGHHETAKAPFSARWTLL